MPGKRLAPGQTYAGRRADRAVLNVTLPREAAELIRSYSGGKAMGAFIAQLVQQYHGQHLGQHLERKRLQAAFETALEA